MAASNVCSGGATRSNSRGNCDKHPIAANRLGSPGPTGSGSSLAVSDDPDGDRRNCGRPQISWEINYLYINI